jgi:hypothetical protein
MKSKSLPWVALAALASTVLGKASQGETITHGVPPVPPDPGDTVPAGSEAICPGVPPGVALIPNLRTGRAIDEPATGGIRLLFSDLALACQELGDEGIGPIAQDLCVNAWSFSMLLSPEMQMPGVYKPSFLPEFTMSVATMTPTPGCGGRCTGGGGTLGGGGGPNDGASLEIYSVTDQCITGRFQGLFTTDKGSSPPIPEINGAFHAVRCTPVGSAADGGAPAVR